mgnify:FL=1
MEKTKTLEISSKAEELTAVKKYLQTVKSSLTSCLVGIKEMWKDWIRAFVKKISEVFDSVSWEDLSMAEELIQEHLSHYWF